MIGKKTLQLTTGLLVTGLTAGTVSQRKLRLITTVAEAIRLSRIEKKTTKIEIQYK